MPIRRSLLFKIDLMAAAVALSTAGLLGGCVEQDAARPGPLPSVHGSSPAASRPIWTIEVSATAGAALVLNEAGGGERLRIACRRNPTDLYVAVPAFHRIGSEDRLTLGAGDEVMPLVVAPAATAGASVEATGELSQAFVEAIAAGRPIGAAYGAQQIRAVDAPAPDLAQRFAQACREALGSR